MALSSRQKKILQIIQEQKKVLVADLAESFNMTEASIRLDLKCLEDMDHIKRFHGGARIVQVADIDGDNDLDVVAYGKDENHVVWYEAPTWTKHVIDSKLISASQLQIVDMDGDNDLDVVAAAYGVNDIVWYESILKEKK